MPETSNPSTADRPEVGDTIIMDINPEAIITVSRVPDEQDLAPAIYQIIDQYGERHLVEKDGNDWLTVQADSVR